MHKAEDVYWSWHWAARRTEGRQHIRADVSRLRRFSALGSGQCGQLWVGDVEGQGRPMP